MHRFLDLIAYIFLGSLVIIILRMILPFVKLGTLAIKTLSKPIASRLKAQAAHHPRFRTLIINFAQANHKFSTQLQRRIYGHATNVAIRPLDEEKAVQAATDLVGEVFIFSVGGAAVIFEVQRSARSDARKEEARKQEMEALKQRDDDLARELVLLKQRVDELEYHRRGRGIADILSIRKHVGNEEKSQTQAAPA